MLRETFSLVLRKDHGSLGDNVENTVRALDKLRFNTERFFDFDRQPGGLREILSTAAIGNRNFHSLLLTFVRH